MDTIARDKLAATARTHARVTGSIKGTASNNNHARLLSGELVASEEISVFRPTAGTEWIDGGSEFKVGPYFTTNVASKRDESAVVAVFADDESIGDIYRDAKTGTWVAFGPTDRALTRPTTFEAAWKAITGLHVATLGLAAEPQLPADETEIDQRRDDDLAEAAHNLSKAVRQQISKAQPGTVYDRLTTIQRLLAEVRADLRG